MPQPYDMAFAFCKWLTHLQRLVGPVDSTAAHAMYEANLSVVEAADRLRVAA
jgi:hypothetical protein